MNVAPSAVLAEELRVMSLGVAAAADLQSSYVTVTYSRDHKTCLPPQGKEDPVTYYLRHSDEYTVCYTSDDIFPGSPPPLFKHLSNYSRATNATRFGDAPNAPYFKIVPTESDIEFVFYGDRTCSKSPSSRYSAVYGSCYNGAVVDLADELPTPVPGYVLLEQYPSGACTFEEDSQYPFYFMHSTSCFTQPDRGNDMEALCGEGINDAYNSATLTLYDSKTKTCDGKSLYETETIGIDTCGAISAGGPSFKTVWCGGPCRIWSRLARKSPVCDPPDSGTSTAVDLSTVLGPSCLGSAAMVGSGQCCYLPLGYDGGLPLGTDCADACANTYWMGRRTHRLGASDAFCKSSDGKYGNCFCGPQFSIVGD